MRIAIDAMGGDDAPEVVVAGALEALEQLDSDDTLVLVGQEAPILKLLGDKSVWEGKIEIVDAPEVVEMDDSPVEALRKKRNSSIAVIAELGAKREVDAVISAGNTGAFGAAAQMRMRLLPGVSRPGILVIFPTFSGPMAVCDVGANIAPKAKHLHEYAHMASIFVKEVLEIDNPTVGLVSIGQENAKGNELVKAANQMLREDERINFFGNVEARDFFNRPADVLICDGFVGNVMLKLTEGLADGLFKSIYHEIAQGKPELVDDFKKALSNIYAKHDYRENGGAPLIGVDGTVIICHGSSDARAIKSAILRTKHQLGYNINEKIAAQLQ